MSDKELMCHFDTNYYLILVSAVYFYLFFGNVYRISKQTETINLRNKRVCH